MLKDEKLNYMMKSGSNIARFISVNPNMEIRFVNIDGNYERKETLKECIVDLINISNSKSVNIRSFAKDSMKGHRFVYGKKIEDIEKIMEIIKENSLNGKYSIINETIDVNDGGVSGVVLNNVIEFAPNDTPRCVEKEGVCRMDRRMGLHMLKTVYGFPNEINFEDNYRVEFSIHPMREGIKRGHNIIWEFEEFSKEEIEVKMEWPNKFSQFIGDKAYGLIVADYLGFNVPQTTVIARNVAPFSFGKDTGIYERWIRTVPIVKEPGKYFTGDKWRDPFELMVQEERKGEKDINIASLLSQKGVEALYSGGAIIGNNESEDLIEGVKGKGDDFMTGEYKENLSEEVIGKLKEVMNKFKSYNKLLGTVSIEWVYDGKEIWIVQLNQIRNVSDGTVIVEGKVCSYEKFYVSEGLESLRDKIKTLDKDTGIELIGNVGISSHFGDVLRQSKIPSFITKI